MSTEGSRGHKGLIVLVTALVALCSSTLTFGLTQVSNSGKIKDVSAEVQVNKANLAAMQEDQKLLRKQVDESDRRFEVRMGYVVKLMEDNQKTVQDFVNLIKVQNELLANKFRP